MPLLPLFAIDSSLGSCAPGRGDGVLRGSTNGAGLASAGAVIDASNEEEDGTGLGIGGVALGVALRGGDEIAGLRRSL